MALNYSGIETDNSTTELLAISLGVPAGDGDRNNNPIITLIEPIAAQVEWPFFFAFSCSNTDAVRFRLSVTGEHDTIHTEVDRSSGDKWTPCEERLGGQPAVVVRSDRFGVPKTAFSKNFTWNVTALSRDGGVIGESGTASAMIETATARLGLGPACELFAALGRALEKIGRFDRAAEFYADIPDPDFRSAAMVEMYQRRCRALSDRLDAAEDLGLDRSEQDRLESDHRALDRLLNEYRRRVAERLAQLEE